MKNKRTKLKKWLSVLLAVTILFGTMPIVNIMAASSSSSVADLKTVDNWKTWFPTDSSRYAGGIYLDKSVYTATEAVSQNSYFYDIANKLSFGQDKFGNDNFMVSLSAVGSTTQITGQTSVPADTVFVLDLSSSMSGDEVETMVRATNRAIEELLENSDSRVGVVLYSGNASTSNNATLSTATVILPLAHYTTTMQRTETDWVWNGRNYERVSITYDNFLTYSNNTVSVSATYSGNRQTGGVTVTGKSGYVTGSKSKTGGTYTQGGLWKAYGEFPTGDATKTTAGLQRKPIVVLMTDGAPTIATTNYNNVGTSNVGQGSSSNANAETSFLVQMTASWVKANLKTKYNGSDPLFYTLGLGVGNDSNAVGILNPAATNNPSAKYWNDFAADGSVSNISFSSAASGTTGRGPITGDQTTIVRNYVDKYYSADDADELSQMFSSIVEEIGTQLKNYPTLISGGNPTQDGYISFTDEIGGFMEVKAIKGIHIGEGSLVTGGMFADYVMGGEIGSPSTGRLTALGTTLIDALETRFELTETQALQLLNSAIANGYISYNSPTNFSNYVAWYADADNKYLAPYTETARVAPTGAKYKVKSYLYLGSATGDTGTDTDMLYILIRVREDLATGVQIVDANMPASLLPLVTYTIEIEETNGTTTVKSMTSNVDDIHPACLLFEVGLKDSIDPYTLEETIKAMEENYGYVYPKNADGSYYFYTNRWKTDQIGNTPSSIFTVPAEQDLPTGIYDHGLIGSTEAHFHPALDNRRYYYTEDTPVLYNDGSTYRPYTGAADPTGDNYYHIYEWVVGNGAGASVQFNYNPILTEALSKAQRTADGWVIPKGTPKRYFGQVTGDPHSDHVDKVDKTITGTLGWSLYPASSYESSGTAQGYHIFGYLGNNGRVTAVPTQGLRLTKTVAETVNGGPEEFDFTITLSVDGTFDYHLIKADGNVENKTVTTQNKVLDVTLKEGEVLYITNIPANTDYVVEEQYLAEYVGTAASASGKVATNSLSHVDFVNVPRGAGSLRVSKEITHPFGTAAVPNNLTNESFEIMVTFTGESAALANITATDGTNSLDGGKTFVFDLKDNEDVVFLNIPEGVKYKVEETIAPTQQGYALDTVNTKGLEGTITNNTQSRAELINRYQFDKVQEYEISIGGTKTVEETNTLTWTDETFQIGLYKVNTATGATEQIGVAQTVSKSNPQYQFVLNESVLTLDAIGTHHFHIAEVIPSMPIANMAYDKTLGAFTVAVNDENADGYLEITSVTSDVGNVITDAGDTDSNTYTVEKNFLNRFNAANVAIPVQKNIVDTNNIAVTNISKVGFVFGLYSGNNLIYTAATDANGLATFNVPVKEGENFTYTLREINPSVNNGIIGMTYDVNTAYTVNVFWTTGESSPEYMVVGATGTPIITNTYDDSVTATPDIVLNGEKTLNGSDLRDGDTFTFELYETGADFVVTGQCLEDVAVSHLNNTITFTISGIKTTGTHYYVVKEVNAGTVNNGIGYDATEYHIIVNVVKEFDGNKVILKNDSVTVHKTGGGTVTQNDIHFNNTYTVHDVEEVVLSGTKKINGRNLLSGEFEFVLYNEAGTEIDAAKNGAGGKFTFEKLTFNKVGSHKFTIKERVPSEATANGSLNGVVYDEQTVYTVDIAITDDQMGGLNQTVTVNSAYAYDDSLIVFNNNYSAADGSVTLSGTKTLEGREFKDTDRFYFELYEADDNFNITSNTPVETAVTPVKQGGDTSDYSMTLNYADGQEGIHRYVLVEKIPTQDKAGVGYDANEYYVTIMVIDNYLGKIVASVADIAHAGDLSTPAADELNFTNVYSPAATNYVIAGEKDYNGTLTDGMFEFVLAGEQGEIETVKNIGNAFTFSAVELTEAKTYTFTVKEVNAGSTIKGITYDDAVYTIKVPVVDDLMGNLQVVTEEIEITKDNTAAPNILFTNSYEADATDVIKITATKSIDGKTLEAEEFTFELYEANKDGEKKGKAISTAKNAANGTIAFDKELTFKKAGIYNFVVVEKNTDNARVTFDNSVFVVSVDVKDDGEGKLYIDSVTYTKDGKAAESIAFKNVYTPKPEDIALDVSVNKTVKNIGSEELSPENFEFVLKGDGNKTEQKLKTDKDGKLVFSLNYTEDDIGKTYHYTVKEVNDKRENVKYSEIVYKLSVAITLGNDNTLQTALTVDEQAVEEMTLAFENVYDYTPKQTQPPQDPDAPESPKTGDNFNINLWLAILFVSGVGLFGTREASKKSKGSPKG